MHSMLYYLLFASYTIISICLISGFEEETILLNWPGVALYKPKLLWISLLL